MFNHIRLNFCTSKNIIRGLGMHAIGDSQIADRISVKRDGRGLDIGIREHGQKDLHTRGDHGDIPHTKVLALQDRIGMTITQSGTHNFQITA